MQFLTDLERLESFLGSRVPPAPLTGGPIEHLGPLLVSTRGSFPWASLRVILEAAFGIPGRIDRTRIGSGWAGLNAVLCAFRRVEAARNEDEAEELRNWLEGLEAVVIQQSTFYSDGSGNLEKVLATLNVPKAFISLFTLTPGQGAAVFSDPEGVYPLPQPPVSPQHKGSEDTVKRVKRGSSSDLRDSMEVDQHVPHKKASAPILPSIQTQTHLFRPPMLPSPMHRTPYHGHFPYPYPPPGYGHYSQGGYPPQMALSPVSYASPASSIPSSMTSSTRSLSQSSVFSTRAPSSHATTPASSPHQPHQEPIPRVANASNLSVRPQLDVITLVGHAILASQDQASSVAQIVNFINENYPDEVRRKKTWEDHVRSTLNTSAFFEVRLVGEDTGPLGMKKRGKLWGVKEEHVWRFSEEVVKGEMPLQSEASHLSETAEEEGLQTKADTEMEKEPKQVESA